MSKNFDIKEYLKQNYVSSAAGYVISEEEWNKYAEICSDAKRKREVDEIIMFQEYYKVNLPIVRKDLVK